MIEFAQKLNDAPLGKIHLFSVGQAGFIVKTRLGKFLGIDLYLSDCVERLEHSMGVKRLLPKLLNPAEITFDYIIATHSHRDHFDEDSMSDLIQPKTKLFASITCEKEVEQLGISKQNCRFVKVGESYVDDDVELHFVFCDHGIGAPDAFGVVLCTDEIRLFFAGDTCIRMDKVDYFNQFGPFDCLVAPINGAWGNMNEGDCAQFAQAIQTKVTIPCHYGMFPSHGGNPGLFTTIMAETYRTNAYYIMTQGEQLTF